MFNALFHADRRLREIAEIYPRSDGTCEMLLPSAGIPLGRFPTAEDARRLARRNGYEPHVNDKEAAPCQH